MRPQAACAEVVGVSTRVSQVTPESPGIPRAMVYGLFRALPGDRAFLSPSPLRSLLLKNLTPASRRQDHTTSPSASAPFVKGASASTASCPASVTISSRPSVGQDGRGNKVICANTEAQYFSQRGSTGKSLICPPGRIQLCRVGKGALAPCPPFPFRDVGGHAEFIIGRAFARPVGFAHPTGPACAL